MLKVRQETRTVRFPPYNICRLDYMACVCSSLCYGCTKVDAQCLQGKVRNITCHWGTEWSKGIELIIFNVGPILEWIFNTRTGRFVPENETKYPILQTDGWAPGSVWTGVEKRKPVTNTGVLTPKLPFRSESLTRKQETFTLYDTHISPQHWGWYQYNSRVWEGSFVQKCSLYFILCIQASYSSKNSNLLHLKHVFLQCFQQPLQTSRR
jgi:hypothetical protein